MEEEKLTATQTINIVKNSELVESDFYISKDEKGRILISNLNGYLQSKYMIELLLGFCKSYLSHIDDETIRRHNLLNEHNSGLWKLNTDNVTNIYVMLNKQNGYYKIGRSNNVAVRERTLQAQEPDIQLIHYFHCEKSLEKNLHKCFSEKRLRGEWFALSLEDVEFLKLFKQ